MIIVATEEDLEHYGIKGMRWGVRRKGRGGLSNSEFKKKMEEKDARKELSQVRRKLSDKDLQGAIDRLQKEKKLKDLVEADLAPGRSVTKKILSEAGQNVARTVIVGVGTYAVRAGLEKKFSSAEAAKYLMPKKK